MIVLGVLCSAQGLADRTSARGFTGLMDGTLKPVPKATNKLGRTLRTIRLRSLELQRDIFAIYKIVTYDTCSPTRNYLYYLQHIILQQSLELRIRTRRYLSKI